AEDGIRDRNVTGVQTCALPICICHSFAADGRCISLLKVLLSNDCIYDCKYCINRRSNQRIRTSFTPEELCTITIEFYKRNYIEEIGRASCRERVELAVERG